MMYKYKNFFFINQNKSLFLLIFNKFGCLFLFFEDLIWSLFGAKEKIKKYLTQKKTVLFFFYIEKDYICSPKIET